MADEPIQIPEIETKTVAFDVTKAWIRSHKLFIAMDADKNGSLSKDELKNVGERIGGDEKYRVILNSGGVFSITTEVDAKAPIRSTELLKPLQTYEGHANLRDEKGRAFQIGAASADGIITTDQVFLSIATVKEKLEKSLSGYAEAYKLSEADTKTLEDRTSEVTNAYLRDGKFSEAELRATLNFVHTQADDLRAKQPKDLPAQAAPAAKDR